MTTTRTCHVGILVLFLLVAIGCGGTRETTREPELATTPLRVGITPDFPPMIFTLDGKIAGVESELAQRLARSLQRPLTFVPLKWDQLVPGVLEGKIDIIMSGMTVTEPRQMQIQFADPYFRGGLVACMRADDRELYKSLADIRRTAGNVGVLPGTTADAYVTRHFPRARRIVIAEVDHAAMELKTRKIDLFVSDGPAVVWLVSRNEADLAGFWEPLTQEYFAWGMHRGNTELLNSVNALLAQWKSDGTLRAVLVRWLPYLDRIK